MILAVQTRDRGKTDSCRWSDRPTKILSTDVRKRSSLRGIPGDWQPSEGLVPEDTHALSSVVSLCYTAQRENRASHYEN